MKDQVRIVDYRHYLEAEYLPWAQKKNEELQAQYAEAKEKYESGKLAKLFGWKYEDSNKGIKGHWSSFKWYNFYKYERAIERCNKELQRLTYLRKIEKETAEMSWDFYQDFYDWCSRNNIPY